MRYKNILSLLAILITLVFSAQAFSVTYTYDNANRLMSVDYGNGTAVTYTYDAAGNLISQTTGTAPLPSSFSINGGAATTGSTAVTLDLTAVYNNGAAAQMRFSNDNVTWSAWEPYAATKLWTLLSGDGVKTVYVQLGRVG